MESTGFKYVTEAPANCNQKCQILSSKILSQEAIFSWKVWLSLQTFGPKITNIKRRYKLP